MNSSAVGLIALCLFIAFIFQGDPDVWDLAHEKVIVELRK